ncbi:MAG TPA: hypothetical protein VGO50_04795 [Pyrinomonadaceae bacterium]|jgi:hypothetical protein|nr:hypothetical protein [Pyrinomonadaceae bacterium]
MDNLIESEDRFGTQNDEGDHRPKQEFLESTTYSHNAPNRFADNIVAVTGLVLLILFQLIFISYGGGAFTLISLAVPPVGMLLGMRMFLNEQEDELAIWPKGMTFANVTVVDFRSQRTA